MKRRGFFLLALSATLGQLFLSDKKIPFVGKAKGLIEDLMQNKIQAKSGEVIFLAAGQTLYMPETPNPGDWVHVVPASDWPTKLTKVNFSGVPLAGDRDHLILDSNSRFRLVYKNVEEGWLIG